METGGARGVWRRVSLLILLAVICVLIGFIVGRLLVLLLGAEATNIFKGVTLASVLYGGWKILLSHGRSIVSFVKGGETWHGMQKPLTELALLVTGAGVVGYPVANAETPGNIFAATFISSTNGAPDNYVASRRIMLPVFSQDASASTDSDCSGRVEQLAKIDAGAESAIEEIACGLRSCAKPNAKVVIDVQGFASSREFQCAHEKRKTQSDSSTEWNLRLAERRRQNVIALLLGDLKSAKHCGKIAGPKLAASHPLEISPAPGSDRWVGESDEKLKSMNDNLNLSDHSQHPVDRAQEVLTRRVDIVLKEGGNCSVMSESSAESSNVESSPASNRP